MHPQPTSIDKLFEAHSSGTVPPPAPPDSQADTKIEDQKCPTLGLGYWQWLAPETRQEACVQYRTLPDAVHADSRQR